MRFKQFFLERVYHGSASKIKGKFSYDKIGSGHGAQAFGYGFYFSQDKNTASSYISTSYKAEYIYKGKDADFWYDYFSKKSDYDKMQIWEMIMLHKSRGHIQSMLEDSEADQSALQYLKSLPDSLFAPDAGELYEVELNATIDEFLDWSAPFKNQSEFIKNKLYGIKDDIEKWLSFKFVKDFDLDETLGREIYFSVMEAFSVSTKYGGLEHSEYDSRGRKDKSASAFLRSLGIKGNKYLAYDTNKYNFVMFSSDDIEIIQEINR